MKNPFNIEALMIVSLDKILTEHEIYIKTPKGEIHVWGNHPEWDYFDEEFHKNFKSETEFEEDLGVAFDECEDLVDSDIPSSMLEAIQDVYPNCEIKIGYY